MLDNSFQSRYDKLPIATHAVREPPGEDSRPFVLAHHHSEFEVIVVTCGRCTVTIDQEVYEASCGDIVLIPPYSVHSGCIAPGMPFSHFCFCFDLSLLQEPEFSRQLETGFLQVERVVRHTLPDSGVLRTAAYYVYQQSESREAGWELIVRGELLFLFGLLQHFQIVYPSVRTGTRQDFCVQVLDILAHTYQTPITSRDAAARLSYSHSYFCRLFHENFQVSFQEYLCQYRLSKARMLLSRPDVSVGDAAIRVGFNNPSYFAKQFRALYGYTPKQFQRLQMSTARFRRYYPGAQADSVSPP